MWNELVCGVIERRALISGKSRTICRSRSICWDRASQPLPAAGAAGIQGISALLALFNCKRPGPRKAPALLLAISVLFSFSVWETSQGGEEHSFAVTENFKRFAFLAVPASPAEGQEIVWTLQLNERVLKKN